MWEGSKRLLLNEYFDDKIEALRLKNIPMRFRDNQTDKLIIERENRIKDFLSMLNSTELTSLILMSLNIE